MRKHRKAKRLSLGKETIRSLSGAEAERVLGGLACSSQMGGRLGCSTETMSHCDPCATLETIC